MKENRTKAMPTSEETSRLMKVRDLYRESDGDQNVCVVLPDDKTAQQAFDNFYPSVRSRLQRDNVVVTHLKDLTDDHLLCTVVIDMTS